MISRFAGFLLAVLMIFMATGCGGGGKPVATEEAGMQGMQDMKPDAAPTS